MHFMNEYEISDACITFADHPVLGPATQTLANLTAVVNRNSDGWYSWPKPVRAALRLMLLIEGDGSWEARYGDRQDVTAAQVKKAYVPIKSFLTRHNLTCELVEP